MTRITLKNIGKRYDNGFTAVGDISFAIESGKFTVLLGPSGSGKSTILRMIAGLEAISSGELWFDDECVNALPAKNRDIGMVFQNYALYPHLTVFENIAFPLTLRREKKAVITQRVQEVSTMVGLLEVLSRKPKELSGGQRQRVALARAIVRKPRVFLFDEPLSNLDAQLRTQMRLEIAQLQRHVGSTALYVTHDQTEAMTMGDTIIVMNEGSVQQIGTPSEIYNQPANRFVAGFLGSPQMNFIEGNLIQTPAGLEFQETQHSVRFLLPEECCRSVSKLTPQSVVIGIRPEHIGLHQQENNTSVVFQALVRRVEYVGHEVIAYIAASADSPTITIVRLPNEHADRYGVSPQQILEWYINTKFLYVFDGKGVRL